MIIMIIIITTLYASLYTLLRISMAVAGPALIVDVNKRVDADVEVELEVKVERCRCRVVERDVENA